MVKFNCKKDLVQFTQLYKVEEKESNGYKWFTFSNIYYSYELHHAKDKFFNVLVREHDETDYIVACSVSADTITIHGYDTVKKGKVKEYKADKFLKKWQYLAPAILNCYYLINA